MYFNLHPVLSQANFFSSCGGVFLCLGTDLGSSLTFWLAATEGMDKNMEFVVGPIGSNPL